MPTQGSANPGLTITPFIKKDPGWEADKGFAPVSLARQRSALELVGRHVLPVLAGAPPRPKPARGRPELV